MDSERIFKTRAEPLLLQSPPLIQEPKVERLAVAAPSPDERVNAESFAAAQTLAEFAAERSKRRLG